MLVTVTNASAHKINYLDTITGGSGTAALVATGGQRLYPLPYPFGHIGELAAAGTKQLPMNARDWRHRSVLNGSPMDASVEWQMLVQAGVVTLAVAAEATGINQEDLFLNAV
jgi:hypothetical protein